MPNYPCPQCERVFSRRASLRNHVRSHDSVVDRVLREIADEREDVSDNEREDVSDNEQEDTSDDEQEDVSDNERQIELSDNEHQEEEEQLELSDEEVKEVEDIEEVRK